MQKFIGLTWIRNGLVALVVVVAATGCPNANLGTLRVWNTTGKTIDAVYCTPVTDDSWGPDLINSSIDPGETRDIRGFDPGVYDVLAVFTDDSEVEEDDVELVAGETFTWNVLLSVPSGKSASAAVSGASEDAAEVRMKSPR